MHGHGTGRLSFARGAADGADRNGSDAVSPQHVGGQSAGWLGVAALACAQGNPNRHPAHVVRLPGRVARAGPAVHGSCPGACGRWRRRRHTRSGHSDHHPPLCRSAERAAGAVPQRVGRGGRRDPAAGRFRHRQLGVANGFSLFGDSRGAGMRAADAAHPGRLSRAGAAPHGAPHYPGSRPAQPRLSPAGHCHDADPAGDQRRAVQRDRQPDGAGAEPIGRGGRLQHRQSSRPARLAARRRRCGSPGRAHRAGWYGAAAGGGIGGSAGRAGDGPGRNRGLRPALGNRQRAAGAIRLDAAGRRGGS